jgi:hypothetical protein
MDARRRIGIVSLVAVGLLLLWPGAQAGALDDIVVEYEVVRGAPGDVVELVTAPVGADEVGMICVITAVSDNNTSTHPNSDLIIETNGDSFTISDVEAAPEQKKQESSVEGVELGDKVTVSVRLGEDGVFSGGVVLTSDCAEPEVVEPEPETEVDSEVDEPEPEPEPETEVLSESATAPAPAALPQAQAETATAAQPTFTG